MKTIEMTRAEAIEALALIDSSIMVELLTNKQQNNKWAGGFSGNVGEIKTQIVEFTHQNESEVIGLVFDNVCFITCTHQIHKIRGGGTKAWTYPKESLEYAKKHYNRLLRQPYLYKNIQINF